MGCMGGLQVRIALVESVTRTVVLQCVRLSGAVPSDSAAAGGDFVFVDVVADMHDPIEIVVQHVAVRCEESGFIFLTAGDCNSQPLRMSATRRQRTCASDRTG